MHLPVNNDDLTEILTGMKHGWYTVGQLYPRYREWAERKGCELVRPQVLGQCIRIGLGLPHDKRGGHSVYLVNEAAISGRAWFKET